MSNHVLITRPDEDAASVAELIKQKGFQVSCEPFLDVIIQDKVYNDLDSYGGVVFTSRNGVRAFCKNSANRFLPVWTVGDSTKELAEEQGFQDVRSASGDLDALEELLDYEAFDEKILYVCGKHISRHLSRSNVTLDVLYHTVKKREISKETKAMIKEETFSHVLFFSKRTADAFVSLIQEDQLEQGLKQTKALCLGASMVESLSVLPWASVDVAAEPTRDSLLALLG